MAGKHSGVTVDLMEGVSVLDPKDLRVEQTEGHGLILRSPNLGELREVALRPCYPISRPRRFIMFSTSEGEELGVLASIDDLEPDSRKALDAELEKQHFIPIIVSVKAIYREFAIPIWEVETDRGPRRLELKSSHDAQWIPGGKVYVRDAEGNPYLVRDIKKLDPASQGLIQLNV